MKTMLLRKTVLGVAGLAFTGGVFAGPMAAHAAEPVAAAKPVAAVQPDKPAVDQAKLVPHGVQGVQSHIDLNGEQAGNAKAIIAATKKA
ncbi:hypothetical protein ABZ570_11350, partial [Micromonospora sp. NPDC007271]